MKTLGERFRWRREQLGLTQEDAVKEINRLLQGERKLTRVTISNIENGGQESMKDKVLLAVVRVLKCNAEWLVNNRGSIDTQGQSTEGNGNKNIKLVPLISWNQIGNLQVNDSSHTFLACPVECSSGSYCLKIADESMLPKFELGDIIFVDPETTSAINNKFVIAASKHEHRFSLKQLQLVDNRLFLKALNPDYPPELKFIEMNGEYQIIGTVICLLKSV